LNLAGAREFLTRLSERVPPPVAHRHHLVFENDRFMVILFDKDEWQSFVLDDDDCKKSPEALVEDLVAVWSTVTASRSTNRA
jgi:hypothetical protein